MAWCATGVGWRAGEPFLRRAGDGAGAGAGADADGGGPRRLPLRLGDIVGWRVHGPRRCVGVWLPDIGEARACPNANTIPAATATAQCPTCSAADPGRAVARNLAVDDPRSYAVYLAWFGDGLVKVGLTAVARDRDRLAEQGALAFTWLARGPFRPCRRLEHAIAATGTIQERIGRSRKLAAWWQLAPTAATGAGPAGPTDPASRARELGGAGDSPGRPDSGELAHEQLAAAHRASTTDLGWPDGLERRPFAPCDLTGLFGLDRPLPESVRKVTALDGGAILGGRLTVLAGHDALLHTAAGALLVDLGLLAGWSLSPTTEPATGLTTEPFHPGPADHHDQATLF